MRVILVLLPFILAFENGWATVSPKLSVSGTATVYKAPDRLSLIIGVETQAKEAEKAISENREKMAHVKAELLQMGLSDKELRTKSYSLTPQYGPPPKNPPPNFQPELVGYRARNTLEIRTSKVDWAGKLIDHVTKEGANVIQQIVFSLENEDEAKQEAIQKAFKEASLYAKSLAEAASLSLGEIIEVSISPPFANVGRIAMAKAFVQAETPISPEDVEVTATVSAVFAITSKESNEKESPLFEKERK